MSKQNETKNKGVKIPFKAGEIEQVEFFLEKTGRKLGPYIRILLLNAISSIDSNNNDQAYALRQQMGDQG